MAGGAGRTPPGGVHPGHEIVPSLFGGCNVVLRQLRGALFHNVEEHEQVPRTPVHDAV